ncbi:MAG: hypothetical protein AMJ53_14345 [Gammaproteobacteria bacterium SG8_11]|nr:MAG: hypothetical protein AMJ53_14345 [Gammaproteobacteria bacterium SG8_11]
MSDTLILAILSISELALITTGLAVYLFLRNRRMSQKLIDAKTDIPERPEPAPQIEFADYLHQNIEQTQQKLAELPEEQAKVLQARIDFLQAEAGAQAVADDEAAYWQQLISGIDALFPDNTAVPEIIDNSLEDDEPELSELDDIDIEESFDNIPILEDNLSEPAKLSKGPSENIETANEDLERLKKIISRQHTTMDELKKSLQEKDVDLENNQELSKKLEEIEIAQAQLNMCVETLEKENERLNELIKDYEDSPHQEQLIQAQQDLEQANERISTLEKENSLQAERITELESEIAELEKTLEQRNQELARVQNLEADLSQTEDSDEPSQDSLLKEIETLTELITQKSEELSKLQNESSDEFGFDLSTEPDSDKAVGSG